MLDFIRGRGSLSLRGDHVLVRIRWGGVIRLCVWGGGRGVDGHKLVRFAC